MISRMFVVYVEIGKHFQNLNPNEIQQMFDIPPDSSKEQHCKHTDVYRDTSKIINPLHSLASVLTIRIGTQMQTE